MKTQAHLSDEQKRIAAIAWLEEWKKLGEETLRNTPPGPTATEILEADRNRLDSGVQPEHIVTSFD